MVRKESRSICFQLFSAATHTPMDRVGRCHRLSQCTLHSRVISYRDAVVTLPVVVEDLPSVAGHPLRRIHKKSRGVKLY